MTDSTVSGNSADTGGGISHDTGGPGVILNSTIDHNTAVGGGGLYCRGGLRLANSTVSGNFATLDGGGVNCSGAINLADSTIAGNSARTGAGLFVPAGVFQSRTTIFADNIRTDSFAEDVFGTINSGGYNLIESMLNATIAGDTTGNSSVRMQTSIRFFATTVV